MSAEQTLTPAGLEAGTPQLRRLETAMLAAGIAAFGMLYCTQALLPSIGADFGVGPTAASLTVSVATGALAVGVLPMSSVAESFGRVRLMRLGLAAAGVLTVAAALAPSFWLLLVIRALSGLALAGVVAVAMGHVGDEVHRGAVGSAMGLYVAGNSLGGVGGRIVPSVAQDLFGGSPGSWRPALGVLAGVALLAVVTFVVRLPPARRFTPVPFRLATHAAAVRDHLRDPGIRRLCGVALLLMGGFVATYNYLTYRLLAAPFDLPRSAVGLVFLAYLAGTVSSGVAGRLADRLGRRRVLTSGVVVMLAGLLLTVPDVLASVVVGLVVFTAGFFAAHSVASGWVARRARDRRAQASALYLMAYYLGSSVGGTLVGFGYAAGGWDTTVVIVAILGLGALGLAAGVRDGSGNQAHVATGE